MAGDLPPLRGREREVDLLRRRVLSAQQDGRGRVVVVSGAPGSGKSRLLQEVRGLAREAGARTLHVAGDPDDDLVPHGALLDAVQDGPDPLLDRAVLAELPTGPEQGWWLRQELQSRLEQVALQQPVLVCVDDLQWCGHGTLQLLRNLLPQLATDAVVWVLTVRSGVSDPAVTATVRALLDAGADRLDLRPLDDAAVALLVGDVLGAVPGASVLASAERAEGQPLLLVELLRGWQDERLVQVEQGRAQLLDDVLPARLRDAVDRRTARLSPPARELLQLGAVLGRRFRPDLLAAVLDRPAPAVLAPLQEVLAEGLLRDEGDQLGFGHDLIRESVTAGIPAGVFRLLRRHAVDVLLARGAPTLQVATMLAESALPGDLEAVETLRHAAGTLSLTAPADAADLSLRALELLPRGAPQRGELVVETVMLMWLSGRPGRAQELASTTLSDAVGADPVIEAQIRLGLAQFALRHSAAEGVRQCQAALALPDLPDALVTSLHLWLALLHGTSGRPDEADAALAHVQDGSGQVVGWDMPEVRTVLGRTRSFVAFHRQEWDRAIRLCEEFGDDAGMSMWTCLVWSSVGQPRRALAVVDAGLSAARRDGRAGEVVLWTTARPRVLYDAGRLEEAVVEAEAVLELQDEDALGPLDSLLVTAVVRAALHAGRPDLVRAHRPRIERMCLDEQASVRRNGLWLTALAADAAGDAGAALAAMAGAVAALDRAEPSFAAIPDLADEVVLTRIALSAGRPDVAARAVAAASRRAEANPGYPLAAGTAVHARGVLDDDAQLLREAVDLMTGTERPLLLASAREDLARVLAADEPRTAVALLDEALLAYTAAGAEHDASRARRRLRVLGVRRRRDALVPDQRHGSSALTPAERDVVRLVAEGGTNRQVAEQLFVSPHTVNTHLRNAFTKLGVRSRLELARLVAEQDLDLRPAR